MPVADQDVDPGRTAQRHAASFERWNAHIVAGGVAEGQGSPGIEPLRPRRRGYGGRGQSVCPPRGGLAPPPVSAGCEYVARNRRRTVMAGLEGMFVWYELVTTDTAG